MAVAIFYISLCAIILMLGMRYFDPSIMRHRKIVEIVEKNDAQVQKVVGQAREVVSHIHFENLHKLIVWAIKTAKDETIILKRKFDSKQPKFLLKPQKMVDSQKHSVSFFLKHITEHKESLKHKDL